MAAAQLGRCPAPPFLPRSQARGGREGGGGAGEEGVGGRGSFGDGAGGLRFGTGPSERAGPRRRGFTAGSWEEKSRAPSGSSLRSGHKREESGGEPASAPPTLHPAALFSGFQARKQTREGLRGLCGLSRRRPPPLREGVLQAGPPWAAGEWAPGTRHLARNWAPELSVLVGLPRCWAQYLKQSGFPGPTRSSCSHRAAFQILREG